MISRKRKLPNDLKTSDCDEEMLSEQLKKFRIVNSPGEIRLQKDLKYLENIAVRDFSVKIQNSFSIVISFISMNSNINLNNISNITINYNNIIYPTNFLITITKYYPHNVPDVKCLDNCITCGHIDKFGKVNHVVIDNWTAIFSIYNIIEALRNIRDTYESCFNNYNDIVNNAEMTTLPDNNSTDDIDDMIDDDVNNKFR